MAIAERDRLRTAHLDLLASAGRWTDVLAEDPTDETAHLALMRQSLELGDRSGVVRRHDALAEILDRELGTVPGPDADDLRDQARRLGPSGPAPGLRAVAVLRGHGLDVASMVSAHVRSTIVDDGLEVVGLTASDVVQVVADRTATLAGHGRPVAVGIDLGEVTSRSDRPTHVTALGRARSLARVAEPGQVLCTASFAEVAGAEAPEVRVVDLGSATLPDTGTLRIAALGFAGRPATRLGVAGVRAPRAGPRDRVVFGRAVESTTVAEALAPGRLVTVTGPGGVGKTCLAVHVVDGLAEANGPPVVWCGLGSVARDDDPRAELLRAIGGVQHADADVAQSIVRSLAHWSGLLVLDNCEHHRHLVGALVDDLLSHCPTLRVLATSREPLGLRAERVVDVTRLDRAAATALFAATAAGHGVDLDPVDPVLDRICRRLDDLPLALELAAARTTTVDLETLDGLLEDRFHILRSDDVDRDLRHRTLQDAIAWSFEALEPELHAAMGALSAFADDFTFEGAHTVAGVGEPVATLDLLQALVGKSLVERRDDGTYRLLESVRLFAREHALDDAGRDRHLRYVLARAERSDALLDGEVEAGSARFESDWDDIRAALAHAGAGGDGHHVHRLVGASARHAMATLAPDTGPWCARYVDHGPIQGPGHARAMVLAAYWSAITGELERAERAAEQVLASEPDLLEARWVRSWVHAAGGRYREAATEMATVVRSRPQDRDLSVTTGLLFLLINGGRSGLDVAPFVALAETRAVGGDSLMRAVAATARAVTAVPGRPDVAVAELQEVQDIAVDLGQHTLHAVTMGLLTLATTLAGDHRAALELARDAIDFSARRGMWLWTVGNLPAVAAVLDAVGRPDAATMLLAARAVSGHVIDVARPDDHSHARRLREAQPDRFDTWWEAGRRLDASTAPAVALASIDEALRALP